MQRTEIIPKIAGLFLVFLLLFHIGGNGLFFQIQRQQIRRAVKTRIKTGVPQKELHALKINNENTREFHWVNDHELRYNGSMYDVVREENRPSERILWCIEDREEEALFVQLDQICRLQYHSGPAKEERQMAQLMLSDLFLIFSGESLNYQLDSKLHPSLPGAFPLLEKYLGVETPPPEFPA
ncbi:hypothetical protein [Croceimicrobium hydrocarbonivorans]|uniref:Uncharacterized protein n=1 Tax=Croceimicrobium hydrocarbonivorans TaxID=2761580 RepID=A0A7H0VJ48_9FLAO|nr:hypothetical protein [Croceimicrobium hydrocarbonivorans]QNR25746.1 hypothetical protein H4K34_07860 [Croceimicrobium hydrocarbonivorans]